MNSSVHSFISSSIHPSTHSLMDLSIYSFIHTFIHTSIYSFIHPFIHASIYSFIHSFIHPSSLIIRSFINPFIQWFSNSPICLIIHLTIHLLYLLIHSYIPESGNYLIIWLMKSMFFCKDDVNIIRFQTKHQSSCLYSFFLSTMERQFTTRSVTDLFILFFCLVRGFLDEECCCLDLGMEACVREKEILIIEIQFHVN